MSPGQVQDKAIETFWISLYNGSYHPDYEMARGLGAKNFKR
jgi:hypothetical protein